LSTASRTRMAESSPSFRLRISASMSVDQTVLSGLPWSSPRPRNSIAWQRNSGCIRSPSKTQRWGTNARRSMNMMIRSSRYCKPLNTTRRVTWRSVSGKSRFSPARTMSSLYCRERIRTSPMCVPAPSASPSCCATDRAMRSMRSWMLLSTGTFRYSTRSRAALRTSRTRYLSATPRAQTSCRCTAVRLTWPTAAKRSFVTWRYA